MFAVTAVNYVREALYARYLIFILVLVTSLANPVLNGADSLAKTQKLKLAYLLKFPLFMYWEKSSWDPQKPITYCFFEGDPLTDLAKVDYPGKKVNQSAVKVRILEKPAQIRDCQVVYFGNKGSHQARAFLDHARGYPILTVNEEDWFTSQGGILRFYKDPKNQLRFEINFKQSKKSGLLLDSRLLRLARIKGKIN